MVSCEFLPWRPLLSWQPTGFIQRQNWPQAHKSVKRWNAAARLYSVAMGQLPRSAERISSFMTVIDGVFCVKRACDKQTRDAFQSTRLTGMRSWVVITLQTLIVVLIAANINILVKVAFRFSSKTCNRNFDWGSDRPNIIFTRESSYCFQRVLAIAIMSVCLFVCPSVTRVDQSKTVQDRITINSKGITSNESPKWEGVGKICDFWLITRCISVTVRDKA